MDEMSFIEPKPLDRRPKIEGQNMLKYAFALTIAGFVAWGVTGTAQESECLHGSSEVPTELALRQAALRFARQVNTVESSVYNQEHRYRGVNELPGVSAPPEGFRAQLSTDGTSYTFSIKDTRDFCHFAYFSDQMGMIYTAVPIR